MDTPSDTADDPASPSVVIDLSAQATTTPKDPCEAPSLFTEDVSKDVAARTVPKPQKNVNRHIRNRRSSSNVIKEVHYHHHHLHSTGAYPALQAQGNFPVWVGDGGEVYPLPIGASTGGNPVPQQSFQQATVQNNFTWILGWLVCCPTTYVCIVIWLALTGVIAWGEFFREPW